MRYFLTFVLFLAAALPVSASDDPPVVPHVDLNRYVGTWYEISSIPKRFTKGCTFTTATYKLRKDGDIKVRNACIRNGEESSVTGKAWVVDEKTNAKLKVRFFWPLSGDYWIFGLAGDYSWALVGNPDGDSLWVLSRTKAMAPETYASIITRANELGFDTSRLVRTKQE